MDETEIVTLPYRGKHYILKTGEEIAKYKPEHLNTFVIRHNRYGLDERVEIGKAMQETGLSLTDPMAAAALRAKVMAQRLISDWSLRTQAGVVSQGTVAELANVPPDVLLRFSEIMNNGHDLSASEHKAMMVG